MAHFAQLDENNVVTNVIVISNDLENDAQNFIHNVLGLSGTWVQTSYNGNFRKNFAGIGFSYDSIRDAFIPPKPFPSWVLNETTCRWDAPTPRPETGGPYIWNENQLEWISAQS